MGEISVEFACMAEVLPEGLWADDERDLKEYFETSYRIFAVRRTRWPSAG